MVPAAIFLGEEWHGHASNYSPPSGRVETESGGTQRRTGGEVKGKEANGVGSHQSSV